MTHKEEKKLNDSFTTKLKCVHTTLREWSNGLEKILVVMLASVTVMMPAVIILFVKQKHHDHCSRRPHPEVAGDEAS